MRNSILSIALLASALAFGSAAFADETETAVNRESLRVAAGIGAADHGTLGYVQGSPVVHGFAGAHPEEQGVSAKDAALFKLGDRGLGNN